MRIRVQGKCARRNGYETANFWCDRIPADDLLEHFSLSVRPSVHPSASLCTLFDTSINYNTKEGLPLLAC